MTIKDFLINSVSFSVPDATISCILELRGATITTEFSSTSLEVPELALADVLMYIATSPAQKSGSKDSDGGWSHTEGSVTISPADKSFMRQRALSLYKKYGIKVEGIGLKIQNLNGTKYNPDAVSGYGYGN